MRNWKANVWVWSVVFGACLALASQAPGQEPKDQEPKGQEPKGQPTKGPKVGDPVAQAKKLAEEIRKKAQEVPMVEMPGGAKLSSVPAAVFMGTGGDKVQFVPFAGVLRSKGGEALAYAPVTLPQGAKITKVCAFVLDNDNADKQDVSVYLNRTKKVTLETAEIASASTADCPQNGIHQICDDDVKNGSVDNANYTYHAVVVLYSESTQLISLDIYYEE